MSTETFEAAIKSAGLRACKLAVKWNVVERHPRLAAALDAFGGPSFINELAANVPVPPSCSPFRKGSFARLPASARSISYYKPVNGALQAVNYKGTEPLAQDYAAAVVHVSEGSEGYRLERFAAIEDKLPLAVTVPEGIEEAEISADVQTKYLAAYGALAPLPLPLLVFEHTQEVAREAYGLFKKVLSPASYYRVEHALADGLGVYAYHYPGIDVRMNQLMRLLPTRFDQRYAALAEVGFERIVESWVRELVRLFYLGYSVADPFRGITTGNLVQRSNSVVDGGFVDVNSILPIAEFINDRHLQNSVHFTLSNLANVVHELLYVVPPTPPPTVDVWQATGVWRASLWTVHCMLHTAFRRAIDSEARPSLTLDPRIREYFQSELSFSECVARLRALAPSETSQEQFVPMDRILGPGECPPLNGVLRKPA